MSQDTLIPLRFPCGQGGMNRSKNFALYPETDLPMAESITTEGGTWRKEGGATKINTVTLGSGLSVLGAYDFWSGASPSVPETIACLSSGNVVAIALDGSIKTILTGFGTGFPVFQEGWDGSAKALYFLNGEGPIRVYTGGSSASSIPKPNLDWGVGANGYPKGLAQHRARMFAYGMPGRPHDIFGSIATNHGDFASPENFRQEAGPGVGDGIVCGFSWRKQLYLIKRPFGVYLMNDTDPNIAGWEIDILTDALGMAGHGGFVKVDDDVLIFGCDGFFYSLNQVQNQGEQSTTPILPLETSDFLKDELNTARLDLVQMVWYGNKRQIMIAAPGIGSTVNNRRIIGDVQMPGRIKVQYSRRDVCPALFMRRATVTSSLRPAIGDDNGVLWDLDTVTRAKDGAGYRGQFETPPRTCFDGGSRKGNLQYLDVLFAQKGSYDLNVEIHRDGKLSETKTFSQQSAGGAVGSVSYDSDVLGGVTIANRRHRVGGDATRVKLIGYNDIAGQDFSIQDLVVWHTPGKSGP